MSEQAGTHGESGCVRARAAQRTVGRDNAEPYGVTFAAHSQATTIFDQLERRYLAYVACSAHSRQPLPFTWVTLLRNYRRRAQKPWPEHGLLPSKRQP